MEVLAECQGLSLLALIQSDPSVFLASQNILVLGIQAFWS